MKIHHPPHIFLDKTYYFLTARTYKSQPIFKDNKKKQLLLSNLKASFQKYDYDLFAWVILDSHYHIEFITKRGKELSKIINLIHGKVSYTINKIDNQRGRKIFYNYWDKCLRSEKDIWTHLNYIHYNPVKHSYVKKMQNYKFSSYLYHLEKYGEEWLNNCFEQYPVIDFTVNEDNFKKTYWFAA